jgi:putative transposase
MFERGVAATQIARELRVTLIGRLFHVRYTLRGTSYLLHRIGLSLQVPAHRAVERDEDATAMWRSETWAKVRG